MSLSDTLLNSISHDFTQPPPRLCKINVATDTDILFLKEECNKESEFDPLNKRRELFARMINKEIPVEIVQCKFGQIFAVLENKQQIEEIPWSLWARILRLYSKNGEQPFKIYFLANTNLRKFPEKSEPIQPQNINGGYTYRCSRDTILVYRAEDATRVLIHELLHACCTDNPKNCVDIMEAETEAWAELIYIALLSKGKKLIFDNLLQRQSEWIIKQNRKIRKYMVDPASREFPWRYTIGKEDVWRRWGILQDNKNVDSKTISSLRLTCPPNSSFKREFGVSNTSTIL